MPPSGPKYFPISVMPAWRCFTRTSGFACARAAPAAAPRAMAAAAATTVFFTMLLLGLTGNLWLTPQPGVYFPELPQAGRVLRHRADLPLGHARRHPAHHAVGVVDPRPVAKQL